MGNRIDENGWTTKVTRLGDGYGVRVFKGGVLHSEGKAATRMDVGPVLRDLLRWVDKGGGDSPMASASRDRMARKN